MSKYVLVDTVLSYRMRYVIELNDDDPNEYALDTVACDEATEFSQEYLDRKSTRLNSSHIPLSRMPSSA